MKQMKMIQPINKKSGKIDLSKLTLSTPSTIVENEFFDFIAEFNKARERLTPYSLNCGSKTFNEYIQSLNDESMGISIPDYWVPASTFFLTDTEDRIYGATNIRHRLTASLSTLGGHIGYGVRPTARGQGIGSLILRQAIVKARELRITKILLTCDKENTASATIIMKHGGQLDSEDLIENRYIQRYWLLL